MAKNYLDLLDDLRAIAQQGMNFSKDPYDLERYRRLMQLASTSYSEFTGLPSAEIKARFTKELGYITPKIGVQGALFDETGKILLEQRKDDSLWGLPAGWVEVGERPEIAIVREFREETSLEIEVLKIIGFYSRQPGEYDQPHSSVHILYLCKYLGGTLKISHESLAMQYRDPASITNWHKDHGEQALAALSCNSPI